MTPSDAYAEPLDITPVRGAVIISTPRCCVALTPQAALVSAHRLLQAARLAASDALPPFEIDEP